MPWASAGYMAEVLLNRAQSRPPLQQHYPDQSSAVFRLRNKGSEKTGPFARTPLDKPLKKLVSVPVRWLHS